METFTKGEVVLIHFLHTNLLETKLRPALVISNEIGKDIILCQITSKKPKLDNNFVLIPKKETKTLRMDSFVRCSRILTVEKTLILKKIGKINQSLYKQTVSKIVNIIK